jgi:hypothetical protein
MINSAQSSEGVAYSPEKKSTTSYESVVPKSSETLHSTQVQKVENLKNTDQIISEVNQKNTDTEVITQSVSTPTPISLTKFVLEAKSIFMKFVSELSQVTVPTKNAQELT